MLKITKTKKQRKWQAALAVCENAANLPDDNAQVPEEFAKASPNALVNLQKLEDKEYRKFFVYLEQQGLNAAQVALQRAFMDKSLINIEQKVDAADQLYLTIFDEVIVSGRIYSIRPSKTGVRYLSQNAIKTFLENQKKHCS